MFLCFLERSRNRDSCPMNPPRDSPSAAPSPRERAAARPGCRKSGGKDVFCISWLFLRRRCSRVLVPRAAREKHFEHLFIHANEIVADELQRRLVAFGGYQQYIVNLANPLAHLHLQLPVTVGLLF